MKHDEIIKVDSFRDMVAILDSEGVNTSPVYCGWGLEVYHCKDKEIQISYDCRNNKNEVTIRRGF